MRSAPLRLSVLSLLLSSLLTACGGGGSPTPSFAGGGIGGTGKPGFRVGPIQTEAAVVVDGVNFDAASAAITIDGQTALVDDVRTGMIAAVSGTIDGTTGVAETVEIEDILQGRVDEVIDGSTIVVLGQRVQVDADTIYGPGITPPALDSIQLGDLLKIYGFVKSAGVIFATRIELEDRLSELSLLGFITNLDTTAQTFQTGTNIVDYSSADTSALAPGQLADGLLVRITGLSSLSAQNEIVATEVRPEEQATPTGGGGGSGGGSDGDGGSGGTSEAIEDTHVEGFVTSIVSTTAFFIGVQRIETTASTIYEGGTAAEVVAGVRVQAEGSLQGGVLTADKVKFEEEAKLESTIATIAGSVLTLDGLPGISVTVDAATEYEGGLAGAADLVVGERVEIRGNVTGATSVTAVRIKKDDGDSLRLQGPVDASPAPADPWLRILGVAIDTTGLGDDAFQTGSGESRASFFATATAGVLVRADGSFAGGAATWSELEIEQD